MTAGREAGRPRKARGVWEGPHTRCGAPSPQVAASRFVRATASPRPSLGPPGRAPVWHDDCLFPTPNVRPPAADCRLATADPGLGTGDWGLETGDWRLETGDWGLGTGD